MVLKCWSLKLLTKSENEPEFNKIPIYYQEMINAWQTLKQKEISCHSVTEPAEQYLWCNHLIYCYIFWGIYTTQTQGLIPFQSLPVILLLTGQKTSVYSYISNI